ncbi:unnamed protein product [Oncorhynchus mykiss]|uniref:Ig-like domain-containing protein n=3 Tax=Oncorhynchus mykiss TaxID=8022 RepID=A0A060YCU2_ONCMY|nr:unnamed protein product [Oncorhynchus mykiss]
MSGSTPFYQKHHRHYDRGYRSKELESAVSQYQSSSSSSYAARRSSSRASASASAALSASSGHVVALHERTTPIPCSYTRLSSSYSGLEESRLSPMPKRAKPTYLAMDKENQIIGYVVPIFRGSQEYASGFSDTEEARVKESAGYMARRNLFTSGLEMERTEQTSRKVSMRESAERISLSKRIYENEEHHKRMNKDSLMHAPEFVIKPRSHTVWEKQCVRLHCTVSGWPDPRVVWYKNNVTIDPMAHPGKYKLESSYNVHSLEINR